MKNLYKCEHCGAIFESWEDASACEDSHKMPRNLVDPAECDNLFDYTFRKGHAHPDYVVIQFDYDREDKSLELPVDEKYAVYKLACFSDLPVSDKRSFDGPESIESARMEALRKQQEWWDNWQKEHANEEDK